MSLLYICVIIFVVEVVVKALNVLIIDFDVWCVLDVSIYEYVFVTVWLEDEDAVSVSDGPKTPIFPSSVLNLKIEPG